MAAFQQLCFTSWELPEGEPEAEPIPNALAKQEVVYIPADIHNHDYNKYKLKFFSTC